MEKKKTTNVLLMILYVIIAILLVVFIVQNWQPVNINIFGLKVEGRSFIVFLVIFILGFFSGWFWSFLRQTRRTMAEKKTTPGVKYSEE
ncbi:MAG: LapA family protein [Bacteroides sp.]|jgi:uncharacterized integral membrane protein|nr:LapA family protein [Bacteroides sp.]